MMKMTITTMVIMAVPFCAHLSKADSRNEVAFTPAALAGSGHPELAPLCPGQALFAFRRVSG